MLNLKEAYVLARTITKEPDLVSVLDFGESFGFLFVKNKNEVSIGTSYILIDKETKQPTPMPTIPSNIQKIQAAKRIPLAAIGPLHLRAAKT